MWSHVLIYNILFKERGTHWCWKYLTIHIRVGTVFRDTALDSLPYFRPSQGQEDGYLQPVLSSIPVCQNFSWATSFSVWLRDCSSKKISNLPSPQGKSCQIPTSTLCRIYQWRGGGQQWPKPQKAPCCVSPEHEGITSPYQDLPAPSQCSPQFKPRTQYSASFHSELQLFFHPPPHLASDTQGTVPCPWSLSNHDCKSKPVANSYRSSGFESTRFERCMLLLQEEILTFHTH